VDLFGLTEGMTMTELADSTDLAEKIEPMTGTIVDQNELAEQLLQQAKEQNIELVGPDGLLNQLTKTVLETALDAEMVEHLGYEKHDPPGRNSGNSRHGIRAKTVLTESGPVEIEVPRDTASTFEPQIVKKRQRRLTGVDEIVLSLTARGLTTGEIAAHFQEVYGARISKDTVSRITEKVTGEMIEWLNRPLEKEQFLTVVANQPDRLRIYFADPHSPWQRGTNENTNGLLRQYFPKGTNFDQITNERLREVAIELNDRPRACLDDRTPTQLMARWRPHLIARSQSAHVRTSHCLDPRSAFGVVRMAVG
jgi:hypothetical protein